MLSWLSCTGEGFDSLSLGLATNSHVFKQPGSWFAHEASVANLNWANHGFPAMMFSVSCQLSIPKALVLLNLLHYILPQHSEFYDVEAGGKQSLWLTSTNNLQSHAPTPLAGQHLILLNWQWLSFHLCGQTRLQMLDRVMDRALMDVRLVSRKPARHFSTWLFRQVYRPWVRLVLQPTRMCFRFVGDEQRENVGSSPYHWLRFLGEGRTS